MLSRTIGRVYTFILYVYLYIQSCLLMAASNMEDRIADNAKRRY